MVCFHIDDLFEILVSQGVQNLSVLGRLILLDLHLCVEPQVVGVPGEQHLIDIKELFVLHVSLLQVIIINLEIPQLVAIEARFKEIVPFGVNFLVP